MSKDWIVCIYEGDAFIMDTGVIGDTKAEAIENAKSDLIVNLDYDPERVKTFRYEAKLDSNQEGEPTWFDILLEDILEEYDYTVEDFHNDDIPKETRIELEKRLEFTYSAVVLGVFPAPEFPEGYDPTTGLVGVKTDLQGMGMIPNIEEIHQAMITIADYDINLLSYKGQTLWNKLAEEAEKDGANN